jgi:hypothetical protein
MICFARHIILPHPFYFFLKMKSFPARDGTVLSVSLIPPVLQRMDSSARCTNGDNDQEHGKDDA